MNANSVGYHKPLPLLTGMTQALTADFYRYGKTGELRFQRCSACGTWRHVPRPMCSECGSWDFEWARSSGKGKVFTWTVVRRVMHPDFTEVPYAPAVIEMEEGVRLVSVVVDCAPEILQHGMPVEVWFDKVTAEVTLPKFRLAKNTD